MATTFLTPGKSCVRNVSKGEVLCLICSVILAFILSSLSPFPKIEDQKCLLKGLMGTEPPTILRRIIYVMGGQPWLCPCLHVLTNMKSQLIEQILAKSIHCLGRNHLDGLPLSLPYSPQTKLLPLIPSKTPKKCSFCYSHYFLWPFHSPVQ